MALIDREYMRRDQPTGSTSRKPKPTADVQRLLKDVKPARLMPISALVPVFLVGTAIGTVIGYYLAGIL